MNSCLVVESGDSAGSDEAARVEILGADGLDWLTWLVQLNRSRVVPQSPLRRAVVLLGLSRKDVFHRSNEHRRGAHGVR